VGEIVETEQKSRIMQYRPTFCAIAILAFAALPAVEARADRTLFDFESGFDPAAVEARDTKVSVAESGGSRVLRLDTGHAQQWPGVTLVPPGGRWDLSAFRAVALDATNLGQEAFEIGCRLDSPAPDGKQYTWQQQFTLPPGKTTTIEIALRRRMPAQLAGKLFGMRGYPGGLVEDRGIDATHVTTLLIFLNKPDKDRAFLIDNVRATGTSHPASDVPADPQRLFPMIDRFGQYIHKDWPGKTHSEDDLARRRQEEAAQLADNPGPDGWNAYGGWAAGPELEATGFFRPEKVRGRWWLVDPAGRLFWSHGADCVRPGASTPITDRQHWFSDLPERGSPFAESYGRGSWAPHGYYQGKRYETYDFLAANLLRKYGPAWKESFADVAHRRLRSWGMNTVANWSDPAVYLERKTPYCVSISAPSKTIEGSSGYWGKFPDVFDPDFRDSLRKRMAAERGQSAGDPWCIGYFLGNELSWGDELSLALAALASPADQAAKLAFVEDLKAKYDSINRLNDAWESRYASWDALLESRDEPDKKKARDDLAAFTTHAAEEFFRISREAVKEVAPNNLYLGCRFAWTNDLAVRAAAKYCDVVSFNRYQYTVADFTLPEGVDMPAIIGEFHFGALDRGMFHTGLKETADQNARAEAYRNYVNGSLDNPFLVGTHWFQYADQATTGRGDGENYQIGLVDVCDTPYPETIEAVREVGTQMYRRRYGD
jgi:hypothetical protein